MPKAPAGKARAEPHRTCVACRREGRKAELVRLVKSPLGVVEVDDTGRAPGRGAYLHPVSECLGAARKRRALERALRAQVTEDVWLRLGEIGASGGDRP